MVSSVKKRTPGEAAAAVAREQGTAHRGVAKRARAKAGTVEQEYEQRVERAVRRVKKPETVGGLKAAFLKIRELVRGDASAADAALEGVRVAIDCGKRLGALDGEAAHADTSAQKLEGFADKLEKQEPLPPHVGRR
ncbi:MAG: hypothetical protein ACAI38_15370 [Myxococcota bacterium]|nr:hypothetical protein [Myxococcota bacterium]